jgi:hypothetical protein
MFIFF